MLDVESMAQLLRDPDQLLRHERIVIAHGGIGERVAGGEFGPALAELSRECAAADDTRPALAAISDLFTDDFLLALLRDELARFSTSDLYRLPAAVIESENVSGFLLYSDANVGVTLSAFSPVDIALRRHRRETRADRAGAGITISASDSQLRFVRADRTAVRLWRSELIGFDTTLSSDLHCAIAEEREVRAGDRLYSHGGRETWTFENAQAPVLMLLVSGKRLRSPVNAEYDMTTQRLTAVSAADDKSSRVQILSTLLRTMRPEVASEVLPRALSHRDHFVRWHVMRELVACDAQAAQPHLQRLHASDPHAQVRRAAEATLKLLES